MPIAVMASSETMPAAPTCFCTSVRCNQQASIRTTSGKANGLVSMLKALVRERPGPAMFGGRAEGEGKTTMRTLLILAAIIAFSASAFAQTAAPKVGGKPLKQVKPLAPMGCKLVGTVKGTKLWAGDCVAASELRGTTSVEPATPAPTPEANPPAADKQ